MQYLLYIIHKSIILPFAAIIIYGMFSTNEDITTKRICIKVSIKN